jgi:phosphatidylglycerophosphate synthase
VAARTTIFTVPNALCIVRLILVGMAWIPALAGEPVPVAILAAIAGTTDVLDGIIARATGRRSRFGSQLDSIADLVLTLSTVAWLFMLRPAFITENRTVLSIWLALGALTLVIGVVRFRRIGDLHLRSAKVAGVAAHLCVLFLLLTGTYSRVVFAAVLALCYIATSEALLVMLIATHEERRARPASVLPLLARRLRPPSPDRSARGPS